VIHEGIDIQALEQLAAETPELCSIEIMKDGHGLRIDQSLNPHPQGSDKEALEALGVLFGPEMIFIDRLRSMKQDLTADHFKAIGGTDGWTITFEAWGDPEQIGRMIIRILQLGGIAWLDRALSGRR